MKINLAYGLSALADYAEGFVFLDLMKASRGWLDGWVNGWDEIEPYLDANGWPTQMPPGWTVIRNSWALNDSEWSQGPFVLTYDGEGTLSIGNSTITEPDTGGRIEFTCNGSFWLDITATDPNDNGEYIRNIRIVHADYEALADSGELFDPDWLKIVSDVKLVRFMDWMDTNGSSITDFADFRNGDWYSFYGKYGAPTFGVPLEIMVDLANRLGADPWFCIPHMATDACVQAMAEYIRDNLDAGLVAHIEYTNEMWNFAPAFTQTAWASAQALALWGTTPVGGQAASNLDYQAMRTTEVMKIVKDVFVGQTHRVKTILGLQNGNAWWLENRMLDPITANALGWQGGVPLVPKDWIDAVAVSSYFGGSELATEANGGRREDFVEHFENDTQEEFFDYLKSCMLDPDYPLSIPRIGVAWQSVRDAMDNSDATDMELIHYEGGQHMAAPNGADVAAYGPTLRDFVRSPQMADLYAEWYDACLAGPVDGTPMHFVEYSANDNSFSWGLRSHFTDMNPRLACLMSKTRGLPHVQGKIGVTAE